MVRVIMVCRVVWPAAGTAAESPAQSRSTRFILEGVRGPVFRGGAGPLPAFLMEATMRHYLLRTPLGVSLAWGFGARAGTILTGGGRAAVTQGPGDGIVHPYTREVSVLAGMVRSVGSVPGDNTVIRLQPVRPDTRAVAFVAISFPFQYGSGGTFDETTPEVSIVYYEQSPENPRDTLILLCFRTISPSSVASRRRPGSSLPVRRTQTVCQ